ncbi:Hypothetical predicted protein [Podarcis lilfordi]|uniref:Uncharacterized protein n=1 Tax=Podarcis lilfordi TaxID=74358 RepID=A0AA35KJX2_9SAUR|nr:Hypothetical predicted protein [Podarcis lilfordi]
MGYIRTNEGTAAKIELGARRRWSHPKPARSLSTRDRTWKTAGPYVRLNAWEDGKGNCEVFQVLHKGSWFLEWMA